MVCYSSGTLNDFGYSFMTSCNEYDILHRKETGMVTIFAQAKQFLKELERMDNFLGRAQQERKTFQQGDYTFIGTR